MSLGVVVLGSSCPWGSCPIGVIVLQGCCPRDNCPQGSRPRGSCPRGSCPRTVKIKLTNKSFAVEQRDLSHVSEPLKTCQQIPWQPTRQACGNPVVAEK